MGKTKNTGRKILEDVCEGAASANECTGAFQVVSLDPEEVKKFHDEYVGD